MPQDRVCLCFVYGKYGTDENGDGKPKGFINIVSPAIAKQVMTYTQEGAVAFRKIIGKTPM